MWITALYVNYNIKLKGGEREREAYKSYFYLKTKSYFVILKFMQLIANYIQYYAGPRYP